MSSGFSYFVILGGMRTGSNLLEEQLAAMPGLACHGELFNPHFMGRPDCHQLFGLSIAAREDDPVRVIGAMREAGGGLPGFRLFHDHDPRAIRHVLDDPKAAKILLTRRPIDSYVSLKQARKTGQWWLGDMTSARRAKVSFDAEEYARFRDALDEFHDLVRRRLQVTGQTAFHIGYDDLSDDEVVAGLGRWLGAGGPPDPAKVRAKVQNPTPVLSRLSNASVAEAEILRLESSDLGRVRLHEPERGPGLRLFRACRTAPLLYMPIRGAGRDPIPEWLESCDPGGDVEQGMTQKEMRRWKREHPGHRSFTIVRHPLPRAHDAFVRFVLTPGAENYSDIRHALIERYELPLPPEGPGCGYGPADHYRAFAAFLDWLKGNLGGQTSLRVDNTWATQSTLLQAIGQFAVPDNVIREDEMSGALTRVAREAGLDREGPTADFEIVGPVPLAEIVNDELQAKAEAAYPRDFMMFGFGPWRPQA